MDFYSGYDAGSVGDGDYQVLRNIRNGVPLDVTTANTPESESYLRNYLKQYICDVKKVRMAEKILVVEEDARIQRILQNLILEENEQAQCHFLDSIEDFLEHQRSHRFDLVVVNYYLADDEVDYDFWEQVREEHPHLEVILLSHVNDREYYQMLERIEPSISAAPSAATLETMTAKMKNFFENIFGGRNGNQ